MRRSTISASRRPLIQRGKPNKYVPRQGEREMARRRRQMLRAKLKAEAK